VLNKKIRIIIKEITKKMVYFYKKKIPEKEDYVICEIDQIVSDGGYFCNLLEYDGIPGFVSLREISTSRIKKLSGLINVGDIEVMQIISIDTNGSDRVEIDLSRRYIKDTERDFYFNKYYQYDKIYSCLHYTCREDEIREKISSLFQGWDEERCNEEEDKVSLEKSIILWKNENTINDLEESYLKKIFKIIEKVEEEKNHSDNITLETLDNIDSVELINDLLDTLRETFDISIRTFNTKKSIYQIGSNSKMKKGEFNNLMNRVLSTLEKLVQEKKNLVINDNEKDNEKDNYKNNDIIEKIIGCQKEKISDQPVVNIGIIGHVAHGKTTLIESLTGVDTRRHKAEVESNRTLNIGYTNIEVSKCSCNEEQVYKLNNGCSCPKKKASIVDCPGHNVLLSTMISGVSIMDSCIVVTAANEVCPQPQTEDHVKIVEIVGKTKGNMIVQNKCDLVKSKKGLLESYSEIRGFFHDTTFQNAPIIPTSAQYNINLETIYRYIWDTIIRKESESKDQEGIEKGFLVRAFDINKPGSSHVNGIVLGGSIMNGTFSIGDDIILLPSCIETKIISMKTEKIHLQYAKSGGLIAIGTNLNPKFSSILIGESFTKKERFQKDNLIEENHVFEAKIYLFIDLAVNKNDRITINYLGRSVPCIIIGKSKQKHYYSLQIKKRIYQYNDEYFYFTIISQKNQLLGYGYSIQYGKGRKPADELGDEITDLDQYKSLLGKFHSKLSTFLEEKQNKAIQLPTPNIIYKNTFTTFSNFADFCNILCIHTETLAKYVHSELGCSSFSLSENQNLILKGRINEFKMVSVLNNFIKENKCSRCLRYTTNVIQTMRVKKLVCKSCIIST